MLPLTTILASLSYIASVAAQVVVPSGAVLPPGVPNPAPTANSFKPHRPTISQPTSNGVSKSGSAFDSYHFAVTTFLIILGCAFGAAGLVVAVLVVLKWIRRSGSSKEEELLFEREQQNLAERTATLRRGRGAGTRAVAGSSQMEHMEHMAQIEP